MLLATSLIVQGLFSLQLVIMASCSSCTCAQIRVTLDIFIGDWSYMGCCMLPGCWSYIPPPIVICGISMQFVVFPQCGALKFMDGEINWVGG